MKYLTKEQMQKLTTQRLLAYKRKHLSHNHYAYCKVCDGYCEHRAKENAKEIKEWETAHKEIKEVLATRENVT